MLTVTLASVGNPDFGQDPSRPLPGVRNIKRPVESVKHASAVCRDWIEANGVGGGNWAGGMGTLFPPTRDEALARAIAIGQEQVRADYRSGVLPRGVRTFSRLHDYVDANEYGDLCEIWFEGAPDVDAFVSFCNRVQSALHSFVASVAHES